MGGDDLESQERMVAVVRPQMLGHVLAVCERWELHTRSSARSPTPASCGRSGRTRSSARSRRASSPTSARATASSRRRARGQSHSQIRRTRGAGPSSAARLREPPQRSSIYRRRPSRRLAHGAAAGARRGRAAAAPRLSRPRRLARRHRPDGTARPAHRRPPGGARGSPERLHRRQPIGLTDCLNFGNPEKGEIAWELVESIEGMAETCEALRIRSSPATSRSTTRPTARDRPDAGRRLRRPARGHAWFRRAGARAT